MGGFRCNFRGVEWVDFAVILGGLNGWISL